MIILAIRNHVRRQQNLADMTGICHVPKGIGSVSDRKILIGKHRQLLLIDHVNRQLKNLFDDARLCAPKRININRNDFD